MMASEFQTWESLYWPEHVPRTTALSRFEPSEAIFKSNNRWQFQSKEYSINQESFIQLVKSIAQSLSEHEKLCSFAVLDSDPLVALVGATVAFMTGVSVEIKSDPSVKEVISILALDKINSTGNALQDFGIKNVEQNASSSSLPAESSVCFVFPDDSRVIYSLQDLWNAVESFSAFSNLQSERGIAVIGSACHEYGFFISISAIISGLPLVLIDNSMDVQKVLSSSEISAVFLTRDSVLDNYGKALSSARHLLNFVGVEGPVNSRVSKSFEKAFGVPVLQMYGISGRGIVLSSPKEFNVHGSVGIPITNAEAVIGDNYEGNWMRDRILIGPGTEGELLVRGTFFEPTRYVGDARQTTVKLGVLDQSTEWISTGITGKMDENGYFYLENSSLR